VIEYLANYCVIGLLWGSFLLLRYAPSREGLTAVNWLIVIMYWPISTLTFMQGCIIGAGLESRPKQASLSKITSSI